MREKIQAQYKRVLFGQHETLLSWRTDAQRIQCAVRKRCKQLHPYLSSVCQSPSNRSRNRYRGGSGSTSFSSSTMVLLLLRLHRQRQISRQTRTSTLRRWTPQIRLRFPLLFKTQINKEHTDTLHGIVFDLPPKQKKTNFSLFFPGTRLSAALLFSQPRQQVEDVHPSVRTGEAPLLL